MSIWEFYLIFGFGLLSSLHCVQMCGPIVLSFTLPSGAAHIKRANPALLHLAYNAGRVTTYSALGALAGLVGGTVNLTGRLAGLEHAAAIVTGALMIVVGLLLTDILPQRYFRRLDPLRLTSRLVRPLGRRVTSPSLSSKFVLGLLLGFLPCGLIYAALLKAMATGNALAGALTMAAFGLGTAGALFAVGLFSSALSFRLNRWGSRLAAISILLLGVFILLRGALPMATARAGGSNTEQSCHEHVAP